MTETLKNAAGTVRKELERIREADEAMRAAHAAAVLKRDAIAGAIPPVDELIGNMRAAVAEAIDLEPQVRPRTVIEAFAGELNSRGDARRSPGLPFFAHALTLRDWAALAPEMMTDIFEAYLKRHASKTGIHKADLPAAIAEADLKVQQIEIEHTSIVDAAAEAGLTLALLPAVRERRDNEARAAELQRDRQARKAEAIAAINSRNTR